jgi:hypothetical protein
MKILKEISLKSKLGEGRKSLNTKEFLPLPLEIKDGLKDILEGRDKLRSHYAKHSEETENQTREFSLDGRLVGDIGELVASYIADLVLTGGAEADFDGHLTTDKSYKVQVRCSFRDGNIAIKHAEGHFIGIQLNENNGGEFRVIYDGPAELPWQYVNCDKNSGQRNTHKEKIKSLKSLALGTWSLLDSTSTNKICGEIIK